VSGLIEGDDTVIGGEGADLVLPVFAVAAPAVQEYETRVALAADLGDEAQPVVSTDGVLDEWAFCAPLRLGAGPPGELRVLVC
jgi:hypothetical protein